MLLRGVILCGCLLVAMVDIADANPRPDFAVNGQISGSAAIGSLALESKDVFVTISSTVLNPTAGYRRLNAVNTAMQSIASQLSTAGQTLSQAIATLTQNNSGPIGTYFDAVTSAANAFRALINGGLNSQLTTVTNNVQNFISVKFIDSFRSLSTSLTSVTQTLSALRSGVQSARTAAGNTNPIPQATLKKYVTTRMVTDVNNAVRLFRSDLPILEFIVKSTLSSLQSADEYLLSITGEAGQRATEVAGIANSYGTDVQTYADGIKEDISYDLNTPHAALTTRYGLDFQSRLSTVAGFEDQYSPIFQTMQETYANGGNLPSTIDTRFAGYIATALALDDDLGRFYGTAVCTPLKSVIQVLIANGPNAQFCFSKFAQKVFNMFVINTFDTSDCYRLQLTRFERFRTALLDIVRLIVHDIEDFIGHLQTCSEFHDRSACTTYLGTEYTTLLTFTKKKRDYLERLLTMEVQASLYRLEGCFSNSKHLLILDSESMEAAIQVCTTNGPVAG